MPDWVVKTRSAFDRTMEHALDALKAVVRARDDSLYYNRFSNEMTRELGISMAEMKRIGATMVAELRDQAPADKEGKVSPTEAWLCGFLTGSTYERSNDHDNEMHGK